MKRLLALAGSAIIGAFGAVALATPAQAHHPIIEGKAICQADGTYQIAWIVSNGNWENRYAVITAVSTSEAAPIDGFGVNTRIDPSGKVRGTQTVPGDTAGANLSIAAKWYNPDGSDARISAVGGGEAAGLNGRTCQPQPDPTATFVSNCDGTINVHIVNPGSAANFTVTGITDPVPVSAKGEKDVTVPAGTEGKIVVKKGDAKVAEYDGWKQPEECANPEADGKSTCDTFTISLTNPQGNLGTTATVTYGSQKKEGIEIKPGETVEVELNPSSETEAIVEFGGWPGTVTVTYEKPEDCEGLPVTGANVATYVGTGTGVAALGVFLFYLARRRQIRLRRMAA